MFEEEATRLEKTFLTTYGISISNLSDSCIEKLEDIVLAYSKYNESEHCKVANKNSSTENTQRYENLKDASGSKTHSRVDNIFRNKFNEGKLLRCWNTKQLEIEKLDIEVSKTRDDIASIRREVQTIRNKIRSSKLDLKIIEDEEAVMSSGNEDMGSCSSIPFMKAKMVNYAKKSKEYRVACGKLNTMMKERKTELEKYSHEALLEKSNILKELISDSEVAAEKRAKYLDLSSDPEVAISQIQQAKLNLQKLESEFEQKVADFAM
mmetsp:Transcript_5388/g.6815  ORF Transcript_5388/g.6815 Transcript_5388/m.6815 type:complete len:265 (+) Transcript_5388:141-935(+)